MSMLSESDKDDLIKTYDWTIDEEFRLPESCPAIRIHLERTRNGQAAGSVQSVPR